VLEHAAAHPVVVVTGEPPPNPRSSAARYADTRVTRRSTPRAPRRAPASSSWGASRRTGRAGP
jgi:hypothetical protein